MKVIMKKIVSKLLIWGLTAAIVLSPINADVSSAVAKKVKLSKKKVTVYVKKKETVKVKNSGKKKVKAKIANKKIASVKVSKKQLRITGKKEGKTKLTVTVKGMKRCKITVTVKGVKKITTQKTSQDGNTGLSNQEVVINAYKEFLKKWVSDVGRNGDSAHIVDSPIGPILITSEGTSSVGKEEVIYKYIDGVVVSIFSGDCEDSSLYFSYNKMIELKHPNSQQYGPGSDELVATLYEFVDKKYTKIDSQSIKIGPEFFETSNPGYSEEIENKVMCELKDKNSLSNNNFVETYKLEHLYCMDEFYAYGMGKGYGPKEYVKGCDDK